MAENRKRSQTYDPGPGRNLRGSGDPAPPLVPASLVNLAVKGVRPDMKDAIKAMSEEGWVPSKTSGGHIKLEHPHTSTPVFCSSTPSDKWSHRYLRRDCRNALMSGSSMIAPPPPLTEEEVLKALRAQKTRGRKKPIKPVLGHVDAHPHHQVIDRMMSGSDTSKPMPDPVTMADIKVNKGEKETPIMNMTTPLATDKATTVDHEKEPVSRSS